MKGILLTVFLLITTAWYVVAIPKTAWHDHLTFFLKDSSVTARIGIMTNFDHDSSQVLLTRVFHNKATLFLEDYFVNISQVTDLSYLYSLTPLSFYARDNESSTPILPAIELPFFLIALVAWIRDFKRLPKIVPLLLLLSVLAAALFLPYQNPVKLIPLVIMLRAFEFFGIADVLKRLQRKQ